MYGFLVAAAATITAISQQISRSLKVFVSLLIRLALSFFPSPSLCFAEGVDSYCTVPVFYRALLCALWLQQFCLFGVTMTKHSGAGSPRMVFVTDTIRKD